MTAKYIEQIICVNTHIQQLLFNQKLMKRNKAKNLMRKRIDAKKGKRKLEANKRNAKPISVRFVSIWSEKKYKQNRRTLGASRWKS
jgi:hypothetical protein